MKRIGILAFASAMVFALLATGLSTDATADPWPYGDGEIWTVDENGEGDFLHIHDAVNTAKSGDTIHILNGNYSGAIFPMGKSLRFIGEEGTRLSSTGYNLFLISSENTHLENIEFSNTGIASNIYVDNVNNLTLRNVSFSGNVAGLHAKRVESIDLDNVEFNGMEYGVHLEDVASMNAQNCSFSDITNTSIVLDDVTDTTIEECTFDGADTAVYSVGGGAISLEAVSISNSTFQNTTNDIVSDTDAVFEVNHSNVDRNKVAGTFSTLAFTTEVSIVLDEDSNASFDLSTYNTNVVESVSYSGTNIAFTQDGETLVFIPPTEWSGEETAYVTVEYNDGSPSATIENFVVYFTVNEVNDPPVGVGGEYDVLEDGTLAINVFDHFIDGDSIPSFTYEDGTNLDVTVEGFMLSIEPIADWHGEETVVLTAEDGEYTVDVNIEITVTPVNDAPLSTYNGEEIQFENTETFHLDLSNVFSDVDSELSYTPVSGWLNVTLEGDILSISSDDLDGEDTLVITVSDGEHTVDESIVVNVNSPVEETPVEEAPVEEPTPQVMATQTVEPEAEVTTQIVEPEAEVTTQTVEPEATTQTVEPEAEVTTQTVEPEAEVTTQTVEPEVDPASTPEELNTPLPTASSQGMPPVYIAGAVLAAVAGIALGMSRHSHRKKATVTKSG